MTTLEPIDTVITARHILPMRESDENTSDLALLLNKGRIVDVVDRSTGLDLVSGEVTLQDFDGASVIPGFVDPHAHTEVAALTQFGVVDTRVPKCSSITDVLNTLKSNLGNLRDGWLIAQGNLFYDRKLVDGRFPTRSELDSVSRDVPIIIRAGGHLSILNSKALELAGIDATYQTPRGSVTGQPIVDKDATGAPTGIVMEMDNLVPFPRPAEKEILSALELGVSDLFTRFGVTTIGEISETIQGLRSFKEGIEAGSIAARLSVYLWVPGTVALRQATDQDFLQSLRGADASQFQIAGVKVFADGGFSAAQAGISSEYVHVPGSCGHVALSSEEILEVYASTREAGLQLAIHANGDRTQLEVCEAIARARKSFGEHPGVRIEHAGNFVPNYKLLAEAWKAAGIIPVPQPVFIRNFGEFVPDYVGQQAWKTQFPFKTMLSDGWPISGSSDIWVGSDEFQSNPFRSMATTRNRLTFHGKVLDIDEAITPWQALWMHTVGGAQALGRANQVGSFNQGAFADFSVLDRNPLHCSPEELEVTEVTAVYLNGERVHGS